MIFVFAFLDLKSISTAEDEVEDEAEKKEEEKGGGGRKGIEDARFESGLFLFLFIFCVFFASLIFGVYFDSRSASEEDLVAAAGEEYFPF